MPGRHGAGWYNCTAAGPVTVQYVHCMAMRHAPLPALFKDHKFLNIIKTSQKKFWTKHIRSSTDNTTPVMCSPVEDHLNHVFSSRFHYHLCPIYPTSVYQPFPAPIQLPDTPVSAALWQSTQFLWSTSCPYLHYPDITGMQMTNFPCGLLSVATGAWTNPCVSNTTIRGERHYPVENNNPGTGCSVHCTFSSLEDQILIFLG